DERLVLNRLDRWRTERGCVDWFGILRRLTRGTGNGSRTPSPLGRRPITALLVRRGRVRRPARAGPGEGGPAARDRARGSGPLPQAGLAPDGRALRAGPPYEPE